MRERLDRGRFSVDMMVANNRDVVMARPGVRVPDGVRHLSVSGVINSPMLTRRHQAELRTFTRRRVDE